MYTVGGVVRPLRGRLEGVCDTPLPKPDKCLLNTYLLNPILVNNLVPGVGAYRIRPGVYLTGRVVRPLRGRLEGVCDTPLPIRDKNLINTYLLNPIAGKDGIHR